jgi:nicotinamide N-methyltransferase
MLLPSLITLHHPPSHIPTPEDIFSSTLGSIFTDDLQNQHGTDIDTSIIYSSARFGSLEFRTADVNGEEQRRKFAHYLWNAGVLMGELVAGRGGEVKYGDEEREENLGEGGWWVGEEEARCWSVEGEKVLELGAGALGWT